MSLGNKEVMSKNLKYYMDKKRVDRNQLCSDLDLKYMTVSDWINAKTYPRIDKIELLANYFGINKSDLIEEKTTIPVETSNNIVEQISGKVVQLQKDRQENVLSYAVEQLEEQKQVSSTSNNVIDLYDTRKRVVGIVDFSASAGTGVWQDENLGMEVSFYEDDMADDYDSIGIVMGSSMEPVLKNGDYLFVKVTSDIPNGAISIWQVNGENFVKKFRKNKKPYLESLNPEFDDIDLHEDDDIRPLGIVVEVYREN
ncbi:TPA: helix-turn-helix domain-containing protein [Streptococcus suis]|nr:helix-turn-helix domain-containing protein [Streptococcus suis]